MAIATTRSKVTAGEDLPVEALGGFFYFSTSTAPRTTYPDYTTLASGIKRDFVKGNNSLNGLMSVATGVQ
jgi:hypothetical protein